MRTFAKCQCLLVNTHSRAVVFPLNVLNLFMFCKECHSCGLSPSRFMDHCRMFTWLPPSVQEVISVQKRDSIICGGQVSNGWRQPRGYSRPNWKMSSRLLPLPSPHGGRVERGKILRFGIHHHWAHSQFILEKWPSEVRLRLRPPIAGFQHLVKRRQPLQLVCPSHPCPLITATLRVRDAENQMCSSTPPAGPGAKCPDELMV